MAHFFFASRTDWEFGENEISSALGSMKERGEDVIDLTESNPTRAGIDYPATFLLPPLASLDVLRYDPHPKGRPEVREALSRYYQKHNVVVSSDNFLLTSATSEGYSFIFRLLANPGEKVLIPAPSYPLFSYLVGLNDAEVGYYRIVFDRGVWRIDMDSLQGALDGTVKAVVLVSPNNPTGSCVKADELVQLNALAVQHGFALVCDEVFADYTFTSDAFRSLAGNHGALTFTLGGLSKALALPQMKLSWIAVSGPNVLVASALERLEVIADTYLSVNTPVQVAAPVWLTGMAELQGRIMARVRGNLDMLREAVSGAKDIELLPSEGGWYAVLRMPKAVPEEAWTVRLLQEKKVYVHPGYFFDFEEEGYIVLSLLPPAERFAEGVRRLLAA